MQARLPWLDVDLWHDVIPRLQQLSALSDPAGCIETTPKPPWTKAKWAGCAMRECLSNRNNCDPYLRAYAKHCMTHDSLMCFMMALPLSCQSDVSGLYLGCVCDRAKPTSGRTCRHMFLQQLVLVPGCIRKDVCFFGPFFPDAC